MSRQFAVLGFDAVLTAPCEPDVDAATATVYDSSGTALAGSPTVTIPVTGQLGADAGCDEADPYTVDISGGDGLTLTIGDMIRLRVDDDASLSSETALVAAVSPDGSLVRVTTPLRYSYSADDEVIGPLSVQVPIDASLFTEAQTMCRCRVVMSHGTLPDTVADIVFDVVLSPVTQPITEHSLASIDPIALDQLPDRLPSWAGLLERSFDRVLELLAARGIYPGQVIDDAQLLGLHHLAFRLGMAEMGITPPNPPSQGGAAEYYHAQLAATIDSLRVRWVGAEDGTEIAKNETNHSAQPRIRV